MINLWYNEQAYPPGVIRGPVKVLDNTIMALEDLNIPFSLNNEKYKYNWILHWDPKFYLPLKSKDKVLVGPQIWLFDDNCSLLEETDTIICPSQWVYDFSYLKMNISADRLLIWPCPIYTPSIVYNENPPIDCLIYHKNRSEEDLYRVVNFLNDNGISFIKLNYGNYSQQEFKDVLSSVKFCCIIDNTESQGIAIQEMMSCNKPLFVWDCSIWEHMGEQYAVPATSVPYWSDKCGKKFINSEDLESSFEEFADNFGAYNPAEFVEDNLSPQKSIDIILDHFSK